MPSATTKPLTSDPYDILLGHNRWAIRELLNRCRPLTEDQFHQRFDIGPGSLHDTLTHMIGAIARWCDRIDRRPLRASIERRPGPAGIVLAPVATPDTAAWVEGLPISRRSVDELLELLDAACTDFASVVARARPHLAEVRDWTFGPKTYRFNVAAAIIHVTNHGMHHRAQCMNMLKRLDKPVNADLDELEWQLAGEP